MLRSLGFAATRGTAGALLVVVRLAAAARVGVGRLRRAATIVAAAPPAADAILGDVMFGRAQVMITAGVVRRPRDVDGILVRTARTAGTSR